MSNYNTEEIINMLHKWAFPHGARILKLRKIASHLRAADKLIEALRQEAPEYLWSRAVRKAVAEYERKP